MVILKKTGKFTNRRGDKLVVVEGNMGYEVVEKANVREAWVSSGGSFETAPIDLFGTREAAKLPSAERTDLLKEGYRLWKYDALGGTIVSLTTWFVLGRGVTFTFDDENAQFHIEKFFKKNRLEMRLRSASDESVAFGDIFMWLRPKTTDVRLRGKVVWRAGDTQVTFIDPELITHIESADDDPSDVFNYIYEYVDAERQPHREVIPDISKYDVEAVGDGVEQGCIVHIKLNAGNMDPFGHSDLLRVKEWLDNYQEYLRDGVIINKLYRSPCFDISIDDGSIEEVTAAISRYRSWTIGSNPVHNSRETWQILEFTGPNTSSENARRALLLIIAAGVGFAEYMLADGSNANLASSKSQQLPVIKKFEDRQDIFSHFLMEVFQFALLVKSVLARNSRLNVEKDIEGDIVPFKGQVKFPTIAEERDVEVAQTNSEAVERHYMSLRTAASRLGLNFDREVELMLKDKGLLDKLKEAGIITDPIEQAMKLEQVKARAGNSQQNNGQSPSAQRTSDVSINTQ